MSILNGAKIFSLAILQNYLIFITTKIYIKYFIGTTRIESWKSNGMPEESIENIIRSESNFSPTLPSHPARGRRDDDIVTSFCPS